MYRVLVLSCALLTATVLGLHVLVADSAPPRTDAHGPAILIGKPIRASSLAQWRRAFGISFTQMLPQSGTIGSTDAILAAIQQSPGYASTKPPSGVIITAVRYGRMTDHEYRSPRGLVINNQMVWVIVFGGVMQVPSCPAPPPGGTSHCPKPSIGSEVTVIDARTGKGLIGFNGTA